MKTLRVTLLGATFLFGAAAAAHAADVYRGGSLKDAPVAPVDYAPAITWTGFYFGGHLGAAFDDDDSYFFDGKEHYFGDDDDTEWLAGIHVGYNWHKPSGWLFGVEADMSFPDGLDYLATIRGRLGYAMGNALVYATGGWAFAGLDDKFVYDDFHYHNDDTEHGWVAGLGLEYKMRQNVSFGLEGLYYDFGDNGIHHYENGDIDGHFKSDENDFWVVRARLTYHFGGGAY